MSVLTRTILILMLAGGAAAQEEATTTSAEEQQTTTASTETAAETATAAPAAEKVEPELAAQARQSLRNDFINVVDRHPWEVARILSIDPTMVRNEPFLARYPDLAEFIAQHPEIRRNPHYYVQTFDVGRPRQPFEEAVETMSIVAVFALIAFALAWLVRTIIEQKRWNQLSRRQSEVHNKILDRFGSTNELLDYIKTPAGTKFLESAPIPLHVEKTTQNAPLTRIMWSIQLGVVVAIAALGMLLLSLRFDENGKGGEGFFALGVIGLSIGAGFIASAVVSLKLSRRLGTWKDSDAPPALDDSGLVR